MTCIVGLLDSSGNVYMGGDSAAVGSWYNLFVLRDPKVFVRDDLMIGITGHSRAYQLLQYRFNIPTYDENMNTDTYIHTKLVDGMRKCLKEGGSAEIENNRESVDGQFLVGHRGRLFIVESNFQVTESSLPYMSIGCGGDFALGSLCTTESMPKMNPRNRVKHALEVAAKMSVGVCPPFHIFELKSRG